ncbi:MAG: tRNA preQ1(34) S-adenosylmethionine ribosyltransferase-isomerase QueA [Gemmatimonadales bacterium]
MKTSDFDYSLPAELIAQHPLPDRGASRLLVLDRASGSIRHARFADLVGLMDPADVLVINTSRVIKARLRGTRAGGQPAELLLVRPESDGAWTALGRPGGKLKPGRRVTMGPDSAVEVLEVLGGGLRRVRFVGALDAHATMARYGEVPLPPYIRRRPEAHDVERYQTVFAQHDGSVAAPTAGLHFTPEMLAALRARGTAVAGLDLHIGPGTFKPVETERLEDHTLHAEWYHIPEETARTIADRKAAGGKVWAVGTTVTRALETAGAGSREQGAVTAGSGETDIFIHPGFPFRVVDHLITNFHLPRSTLLMLVCAFGDHQAVMRAYQEAVRERYRFYSYGDAMAIV